MHALIQDTGYALRFLVKSPAFTLPALLTLALGIGANTAMLSAMNAVLLRPLPHITAPGRLVWVGSVDRRTGRLTPIGEQERRAIAAAGAFERLAWSAHASLNFASAQGAERIHARLVNIDYFDTLGVTPGFGRFFLAAEDGTPGAAPVTVLSWEFWQQRYSGDAAALGQRLLLNGHSFTVVGVAPRGFIGTELADHPPVLWALTTPGTSTLLDTIGFAAFQAVGRLRREHTIEQASAALNQLAAPAEGAWAFQLSPLSGGVGPADRGDALSLTLIGFAIVGAVLLIACANVAGLLLARAARREREIGVRIALGASRARLVRQLLTENAVLALLAGAGGLLVAWWGTRALVAALEVPLPLDLRPDLVVLAGTIVVSLLSVLGFGMVPALSASRTDVATTLAGTGMAGAPRPRARSQRRFVIAQIAVSLVLLVTAGMLLDHLHEVTEADARAADADRVLVASIDLAGQGYSAERQRAFERDLLDRIEALPLVESASYAAIPPLGTRMTTTVRVAGRPATPGTRLPAASWNAISPGYFRTIGTPIVRGRDFTGADTAGAPGVAVVNETMARQFWPGEDAIGKRFRASSPADVTVVGVAADGPYDVVSDRPAPFLFLAAPQQPAIRMPTALVIRARHDAGALVPVLRGAVAQLDPSLPLFDARTVKAVFATRRAPQRAASVVLDLFGALALLLTLIGVYGVMAYAVERRTREIGVRLALGANPRDVLRLLMKEGASLALIGVTTGLVAAAGVTRIFASVAGVDGAAPPMLAGVSALVVACVLAACSLPARRAMKVDPAVALRVG